MFFSCLTFLNRIFSRFLKIILTKNLLLLLFTAVNHRNIQDPRRKTESLIVDQSKMIEKASRSTLESLPAQNKAFWHCHPSSPENFPVLCRFSKVLSPKKRHKSGTPLYLIVDFLARSFDSRCQLRYASAQAIFSEIERNNLLVTYPAWVSAF